MLALKKLSAHSPPGKMSASRTEDDSYFSTFHAPYANRQIEILRDVLKHAEMLACDHPMYHVRVQHRSIAATCRRRIMTLKYGCEKRHSNGRGI